MCEGPCEHESQPLSSLNDWHLRKNSQLLWLHLCEFVFFFKFSPSPPGTRKYPHKLLNLSSPESNPNRPSQQFHAAEMHVCVHQKTRHSPSVGLSTQSRLLYLEDSERIKRSKMSLNTLFSVFIYFSKVPTY